MTKQIGIVINGRFLNQPMTGVQRYAHEVLKGIDRVLADRTDIRVRLLSPVLKGERPRLKNIRHEIVGRLKGHAWEQLEFPRHVQGDVVFCPGNTAPLRLLYAGNRTVVTVHDLSYLYFPESYGFAFRLVYRTLMPAILRRASALITVSESEKSAIAQHYPEVEGRISAIQNGGLPTGAEPQLRRQSQEPTVLYVGSLSKRKNISAMLEVSARLVSQRPVKFIFVGSTPQGLLGAVARFPDSMRDKLIFAGQINDWRVLSEYYAAASCFFFPSLYEASSLPPMEAMACGCPVLAAAIPSLLERCGDAADYCNPYSVDDMVAKLGALLDDGGRQDTLRQRGLARAREFSWEKCVDKTLEKLLEIARRAPSTL